MKITHGQLKGIIREEIQRLTESEVFFYRSDDGQMMYSDDEGNRGPASGNAPEGETLTYGQAARYMSLGDKYDTTTRRPKALHRPGPQVNPAQVQALESLFAATKSNFIRSVLDQVRNGYTLSDKQKVAVRRMLHQRKQSTVADLFR